MDVSRVGGQFLGRSLERTTVGSTRSARQHGTAWKGGKDRRSCAADTSSNRTCEKICSNDPFIADHPWQPVVDRPLRCRLRRSSARRELGAHSAPQHHPDPHRRSRLRGSIVHRTSHYSHAEHRSFGGERPAVQSVLRTIPGMLTNSRRTAHGLLLQAIRAGFAGPQRPPTNRLSCSMETRVAPSTS